MEGPEGPIEHHNAIPVEPQRDGFKGPVRHSFGHWKTKQNKTFNCTLHELTTYKNKDASSEVKDK